MASQHEIPQSTAIAPHYYWVQAEFITLKGRLAAVLVRPARPLGREIVDGRAALKIWEKDLRKSSGRLPGLLAAFSRTILAGQRRPSRVQTQHALIPLAQEVNRLVALHRQLWQQPLATNVREGQVLLSCCLEKVAADLDDLFSFFITTMARSATEESARPMCHVWHKEISCRIEMAAYRRWAAGSGQSQPGWLRLPPLLRAVLGGLEGRELILPDLSG